MPLNAQLRYQARAQSKTRNLPTARELFQGHTSDTPTTVLKRHKVPTCDLGHNSEHYPCGHSRWLGHLRDLSLIGTPNKTLYRASEHYAWIPENRDTTLIHTADVGRVLQECHRINYDLASGDRARRINNYYVRGQLPMEPYVRMFLAGTYDAVRGWDRLVQMSHVSTWSLHSREVAAALSTYVLGASVFMPVVRFDGLREITTSEKGSRGTEWLPIWGWSQQLLRGTGFPLLCYVIAQLAKLPEAADEPDELWQWTGACGMLLVPHALMRFEKDGAAEGETYEGYIGRESRIGGLGTLLSFIQGLDTNELRKLAKGSTLASGLTLSKTS